MAKDSLPRIFKAARKELGRENAPDVVVVVDAREIPSGEEIEATGIEMMQMILWGDFWIEFNRIDDGEGGYFSLGVRSKLVEGIHQYPDGKTAKEPIWWVDVYNKKSGHCGHFVLNVFLDPALRENMNGEDADLCRLLIRTLWWLEQKMKPVDERPVIPAPPTEFIPGYVPNHSPPAYFEKRGNTVCYRKLTELEFVRERIPNPEARTPSAEPAFRKRDHEVRGHWRTYRSGRRVWVRGHRRGDPELGSVTSVITA